MVLSRCAAFAALLMATVSTARAQALADRIPADALVYAGWAGSDSVGPAYDASHLKAFLDAVNLPQTLSDRFKDAPANPANPQPAGGANALGTDLLTALAKSPTALYVGPFDFSINPAQPVPRVALISKIGADRAAQLTPKLRTALQQNRQPGTPPAAATAAGEFLLLSLGDADLSARLTGNAPSLNLTKVPAFQKALTQLGPGAAQSPAFIYIDGQSAVQTLLTAVQADPNTQDRDLMPVIADGAGLNSLQQIAWAGSFANDNSFPGSWRSTTFVGLRDRRVGALAFLDNPPLSQASLKLIPRSATSAGAFRFNGNRFLADITTAAAKVDATTAQRLETVLHQAYLWTGVDVKRELLPAFGDEFIYYASPDAAGSAVRGFTLVNRLRDAKKADSAMAALENYLNLLILQRDPNSKVQFSTRPLPAPLDQVTAHVLTLDTLAPCWAIQNNTFYFSVSLAGLQSALASAADPATPSILDNPQFVAMRAKLAPAGSPQDTFSSFSYAELARAFPETYSLLNRELTAAQAADPSLKNAYTLPPLNRITPALGPTLKLYWSDAAGFHTQETSPFPLAGLLTPSQYLPLLIYQKAQRQAAVQSQPATPKPPNPGLP